MELITQNSYDRWDKQSTIQAAIAKDQDIKQESNRTTRQKR